MNALPRTLASMSALIFALSACSVSKVPEQIHAPQQGKEMNEGPPACPGTHQALYDKCFGCAPLEERLYNATRTTGIREDVYDHVLSCIRAGIDLDVASVDVARGILTGCLEDIKKKNPTYQAALVAAYTRVWSDPVLMQEQDGYKACVANVRTCGEARCETAGVSNDFKFMPPPTGGPNVLQTTNPTTNKQPE